MKLRWKIVIGFALVLAVAAIMVERGNQRARRAVELYRQELRARGEKLTIEELIPPTPVAPNGAAAFLTGADHLKGASSNEPPVAKLLGPGHALVISRLEVLPDTGSSNRWPFLLRDVQADEPALAEIRDAFTNQVLFFQVNYLQGFAAPLPQLSAVKRAMVRLSEATVTALHCGDAGRAWENLRATGRIVRLYGEEPLEICQLVRAAVLQVGLAVTWEALQQDCWQDGQLAELQSDWEAVELLRGLVGALVMESAMASQTIQQGRDSYANIDFARQLNGTPALTGLSELADYGKGLANDPAAGLKDIINRYPRYWGWKARGSYEFELANMRMLQSSLEAVRNARKQKSFAGIQQNLGKFGAQLGQQTGTSMLDLNDFLAVLSHVDMTYTLKFLLRIEDIEVERQLLITAIALKRFHLRHGGYPAELRELVPAFLSAIPIDWMDGKPLRYRRNADGTFLLYSVGEDGVDNGGDPTPTESGAFQPGNTKSVSWWKARDAVWPSPATAEEVRAYVESTAKMRGKSR